MILPVQCDSFVTAGHICYKKCTNEAQSNISTSPAWQCNPFHLKISYLLRARCWQQHKAITILRKSTLNVQTLLTTNQKVAAFGHNWQNAVLFNNTLGPNTLWRPTTVILWESRAHPLIKYPDNKAPGIETGRKRGIIGRKWKAIASSRTVCKSIYP